MLHINIFVDNGLLHTTGQNGQGNLHLSSSAKSLSTLTHKKDLMRELRRINPASVNTANSIFWDVEGALKSVSAPDINSYLYS